MRLSFAAPDHRGGPPPEAVIAATVSSTASASRPLTTTPAPRLHSSSATARPIPRLPPDTTAPAPGQQALVAHRHAAPECVVGKVFSMAVRGMRGTWSQHQPTVPRRATNEKPVMLHALAIDTAIAGTATIQRETLVSAAASELRNGELLFAPDRSEARPAIADSCDQAYSRH